MRPRVVCLGLCVGLNWLKHREKKSLSPESKRIELRLPHRQETVDKAGNTSRSDADVSLQN